MAASPPEPTHPIYRVTVVCLGNICRSPIGEAVLRDRVEAAGLGDRVRIDSAGTGDWHLGYPADPRARAALATHGYELDHAARQITPDWFSGIDLVLAMDESNFTDLQRMIARSGADPELRMLRTFDPALVHLEQPHPGLSIPDPYFGGADGFVEVLRMIEVASDGLVADLSRRLGVDRS